MKATTIFTTILLALLPIIATSQRYVPEDDIYYSPKDKNEIVEKKISETKETVKNSSAIKQTSEDEEEFDVDAYNRRNSTSSVSERPATEGKESDASKKYTNETVGTYYSANSGTLEYGERIKKFHNPEVGLYVVDPEYNTVYLIEENGWMPYVNNINIIGSSWYTPYSYYNPYYYNSPYYYNPWSWNINFNWGVGPYYNPWGWNSWSWNRPYYPYYPYYHHGYVPPRPPRPIPGPTPRPSGNYGTRYTPGGSIGTGGRTDGGTRYNNTRYSGSGTSKPGTSVSGTRGSYGGRTSTGTGTSNRNSSTSGGTYVRPSYQTPNRSQSGTYTPGNSGGMRSSGTPAGSVGGRRVGGRGSR